MSEKTKKKPTIAVLTGGGDVPGLNACIKTLVYRGVSEGARVLGIKRGWAGLLEYNPDDPKSAEHCIQELHPTQVRTIDRSGGTYLHSSRTNPSAVRRKHAPEFLKKTYKDDDEVKDLTQYVVQNL